MTREENKLVETPYNALFKKTFTIKSNFAKCTRYQTSRNRILAFNRRKFIGMELDEKYFEIASNRIQDVVV